MPSTTSDVTVEATGLRKTYGSETALGEVSFSTPTGTVYGFLGPNGAGETPTWVSRLASYSSGSASPAISHRPVSSSADSACTSSSLSTSRPSRTGIRAGDTDATSPIETRSRTVTTRGRPWLLVQSVSVNTFTSPASVSPTLTVVFSRFSSVWSSSSP